MSPSVRVEGAGHSSYTSLIQWIRPQPATFDRGADDQGIRINKGSHVRRRDSRANERRHADGLADGADIPGIGRTPR